jgi:hypothetical protein
MIWIGSVSWVLPRRQEALAIVLCAVVVPVVLYIVQPLTFCSVSSRSRSHLSQMLVTVFNFLYLLIVYDFIRNPWFYMFTDVSDTFMCK